MQLRGRKRVPQRKVVQKRRARRLNAFIPAQDGNDGGSAFPIRAVDQADQIDVGRKPAVIGAFGKLGNLRRAGFLCAFHTKDILGGRLGEENLDRRAGVIVPEEKVEVFF